MTNKVQCTRCGAMVLPATTVVWSLLSSCVLASLGNFTTLRVDFTCKADAEKNATWSDFGEATINTNGIGWDGPRDRYRRGWIQTVPLALDYSWQPPYSVHAAVTVSPYRFLPKDISPLETYSAARIHACEGGQDLSELYQPVPERFSALFPRTSGLA